MYKTVRHGENSLQYTILPQQEDGTVIVKPRKSKKKGKTAAVLTVTTILICGVIATAVLVPLLLTSDLVALPAAFQKFSVSSLHRSHSGNHLSVVAKKPYGWTVPHHTSSTQLTPHKISADNNINNNNAYKTKEAIISTNPTLKSTTTTSTTTSTTSTTTTTASSTIKEEPTTQKITTIIIPGLGDATQLNDQKYDKNSMKSFNNEYGEISPGKKYIEISTSTIASQPNDLISDRMILYVDSSLQSTSSPWLGQRWPFTDTSPYFRWSRYNLRDNLLLPIACGGVFVTICVIIIIASWLKKRRSSRTLIGKITDTKGGDKATLLKETAVASEEE